jgi:hypothetical protein
MGDRFELIYEGLELMYKFNTLHIIDFKDEDLEASNNPFALESQISHHHHPASAPNAGTR